VPEIAELEQRLGRLRAEVEWPATPDIAARVRERMAAPVIVLRRPWFQSRWAVAAAVVMLALAALVAYTPSREAIANWLNLHTIITRVNVVPTPSPQPSGPLGQRLGLGTPTTLADAPKEIRTAENPATNASEDPNSPERGNSPLRNCSMPIPDNMET